MEVFDVLIIGGGPIGINCALESEKRGLKYLVLEKGTVANSIYHYPLYMTFFSSADRLELGDIPFITTAVKPGRRDALEYYQGIARRKKLNIHTYEKVETVDKVEDFFRVSSLKADYVTRNVVIATGFYDIPNLMNIEGEELSKVSHYYREPYGYAGKEVLVVGASNSAVDVALETYRSGARVTMVVRGDEFSPSVKYWVRPDIENRVKEGSIKVYFNASVKSISQDFVTLQQMSGTLVDVPNDFVFAMTGYVPDFRFLESVGIALDPLTKIPSYDPLTMETNVHGIYLAGVVCGGRDTHLWFIENSRDHAAKIISALGEKRNSKN